MDNIQKIDKPWGYEIIWAKTDKYVGKILHIFPACKLSLQYHEKKTETIYVISGSLELHLKDKVVTLFQGQSFHIEPSTVHRFACPTDSFEPVVLAEVSTPELDDVVRLEDSYGRL